MLRYIKYFILFVMALVLITVAMANLGPMTLQLLPTGLGDQIGWNRDLTMPVFLIILGTFFSGLLFGFIWEWLREHKHRSKARTEQQERQRLEQEVKKIAPAAKSGDDVLAILDGR
ncbi:MAG: lipopolysaccharide assembly protein LapA domain-containing protein [Pseudomonadota bacterium]